MSEQVQPTNPNPETSNSITVNPTAAEPAKTEKRVYTDDQVEAIVKERVARERTQAEKKIQEAAEKAALDAAAKNGEWEKLAKATEAKLNELQGVLKARELAETKRTIAEKVGLPVALASRLSGETPEEIETDAKALLETLPKTPKPNPGPVANPGGGQPINPEVEIRRMMDGQSTPWDRTNLEEKGGGVIWPSQS